MPTTIPAFVRMSIVPLALVFGLLASSTIALADMPPQAMAKAADAFLASLDDTQKEKATFAFDDKERVGWHFIPKTRNGLPLKEMRTDQRQLAYALLQSGHSHAGFNKSVQIMTLEQILHEMENGAPHRDPELYHVSIFGTPSTTKTWGWRVEGHHLSVNFTIVDGKTVAPTPTFFGSNPAEVREGPRKGLRVLGAEEDLARKLAKSLTDEQRSTAIVSETAPDDIINGPGRDAEPLKPMGLAASQMNKRQMNLLRRLVREYVYRLRPALAKKELDSIKEAGFEKIHFAWAGGLNKGEGHYYRVQGPTFMLEYDSTQNGANHVHLVWREFDGDFGEDLLKKHYEESHGQ